MTSFAKGDKVRWNTPQGMTHGVVVRKVTADTTIQGHMFRASRQDPQYEVTSSASHHSAIHKPEALIKE
jgi:hypothetical protein